MLRALGFVLRTIIRLKVIVLSVAAGIAIAYGLQLRALSGSWGRMPGDAERELPGDDLVSAPDHVETRSLVIEAPPSSVWPWLAQLGFGRGGWYSYGLLDRGWGPFGGPLIPSAKSILPEHGDLAEGDLVPTQSGAGFIARVVDPDSALVLYIDEAIAREQLGRLAEEGPPEMRRAMDEMEEWPPFRVSWALVLLPEAGGRTRLVERLRLRLDVPGPQRKALPLAGLGFFAVMRQQMLGIKRRVEQGEIPA
jgi:hypothetical protein